MPERYLVVVGENLFFFFPSPKTAPLFPPFHPYGMAATPPGVVWASGITVDKFLGRESIDSVPALTSFFWRECSISRGNNATVPGR